MRAILVPPDGAVTEFNFDPEDSDQWCLAVGDLTVDFINLRDQGLQVIVGGRSLLNGSPTNPRVTWFLKGTGRWLSEVAGTVLIIGLDPQTGESLDVPDMLSEELVSR